MKLGRWPWIAGAVAVVGALALVLSARSEATQDDGGPRCKVRRGALDIEVVEAGKIEPEERVELKSKVAGQVSEVLVDEGDPVKKGQLLLRLDATDFKRDVARAQAELAQARTALEFARLGLTRREQALVDQAASQADVDLSRNEVASRQAAVRLAEVALAGALDRLQYTELRSPLDGTVLERNIEPGEVVTPGVQATFEGRALMTLGNLSRLRARAELNQIDVAKVQLGQAVRLTLDALPGRTYEATVTRIAPASIKPKNKDIEVFPIEATLAKADPAIRPGMTADVRIAIEKRPDVLLVPIEAVLKLSGKSYVTYHLAKAKERKQRVEVQLGARNDRDVEVSAGVKEGDELLIDPGSSAENEAKM